MLLPSTHWSSVSLAAKADRGCAKLALERLLNRYMPALRSYLLKTERCASSDVDDILQAFVADKILQDGLLQHAKQERGRFRSFLIKSLDNFVISVKRKEKNNRQFVQSLGPSHMVVRVPVKARVSHTEVFDLAWGREVIALAVEQLREECKISNRPDVWKVFEYRLLRPALYKEPPMPCKELAKYLALGSESQVSNRLVTAKRAFNRVLQSVVGEYVHPDEVAAEVTEIKRVFSHAHPQSWRAPEDAGDRAGSCC